MNDDFDKKFRVKELMIIEFDNWCLSLRPIQTTLGSMVLSLKRNCEHLGELTEYESKELSYIFKDVESLLSTLFNYDKINYLVLMMVDNHVHFHIIPRYSSSKTFEDVIFEDKEWPAPPNVLYNNSNEQTLN